MPKRVRSAPPAPEPEPAPEREPPEHYMCAICFENPMIDPVPMSCCGQCVCRHCLVHHWEVNLVKPRCLCCGTAADFTSVDDKCPKICIPLRAAIKYHCADALERHLASLPARDKGRRLEKRIQKVESRRLLAETRDLMERAQALRAELDA